MVVGEQPGPLGLRAQHLRPTKQGARTEALWHAQMPHDPRGLGRNTHRARRPWARPASIMRAPDGRVQVHMLMRVGVVERQAVGREGAILSGHLPRQRIPRPAAEGVAQSEPQLLAWELALVVHQCGDLGRRQDGRPFDRDEMQPDAKGRHGPRTSDGVCRRISRHHQTGGRENAVAMRPFDALIHGERQAEIIGRENCTPHHEWKFFGSFFSKKNRKQALLFEKRSKNFLS